ncbi:winged helix-turn-helix transcriptional regulator [Candidatus Pacearchaeota archaeon]|nr:winged helix-turn-helix transcriptional regulator [Candidatus Pacearchaeota archaeon]
MDGNTSCIAYQEMIEFGQLDGKRKEVYLALQRLGGESIAGAITEFIGMPVNNVGSRLGELEQMGLVYRSGTSVYYKTNKLQNIFVIRPTGKRFIPMIKKNNNPVFCPHCGKLIL